MNQNQKAIETAVHARLLSPSNLGTYRQMATILLAEGRPQDAAVALVECLLSTGDESVLPALRALYGNGIDRQGCALEGGSLNPSCPLVKQEICLASADMIQMNLESRRPELAERLKNAAIVEYGCPSSALPSP